MKKYITFIKDYGILLALVIIPIIWIILMIVFREPVSGDSKQVHWHLPLSYNLCGDTKMIPDSGQHGILHGHDDDQIHVEGIVDMENRNETLGGYFDAANITFNENQIGEYQNGTRCEGSDNPGKLSVLVNGVENTEYRNYILNENDTVEIKFQ
ncbi:hypothetical protein GW846_00515 [Candidatus Gracilibacteria bacterium]|nr:hypothetical protein [Candidatus Gracilibacteria bacterium]